MVKMNKIIHGTFPALIVLLTIIVQRSDQKKEVFVRYEALLDSGIPQSYRIPKSLTCGASFFSFYSGHKFRHCLHTTHKRFSKKKYESLHENKDIPQPSTMVTQASEVKGSNPVTPTIQKANCTTERQDLLTGNGTTLEKDNSAKRSKELKRGSVLRGA